MGDKKCVHVPLNFFYDPVAGHCAFNRRLQCKRQKGVCNYNMFLPRPSLDISTAHKACLSGTTCAPDWPFQLPFATRTCCCFVFSLDTLNQHRFPLLFSCKPSSNRATGRPFQTCNTPGANSFSPLRDLADGSAGKSSQSAQPPITISQQLRFSADVQCSWVYQRGAFQCQCKRTHCGTACPVINSFSQ